MNQEFGSMVACDRSKCTGCRACEVACFRAHTPEAGKTVGTVEVPVIPRVFVTETDAGFAPVHCKHCEDAPCLNACNRDGILRIDHHLVIDARRCQDCTTPVCASACPFGAIRLMPLPAKCDLCMGAEGPACVRSCPNQALRLVELTAEREAKNANAARWLLRMV